MIPSIDFQPNHSNGLEDSDSVDLGWGLEICGFKPFQR